MISSLCYLLLLQLALLVSLCRVVVSTDVLLGLVMFVGTLQPALFSLRWHRLTNMNPFLPATVTMPI